MALFEVSRRTTLGAAEAWARMTAWGRHTDFIPFTTVTTDGATGTGSRFVARTQLGPVGFDDPMEVTAWQPPTGELSGMCRITKRGTVVVGWAELTVTPTDDGSLVHWREDAEVRAARGLLDLPNKLIGKQVFRRLVDGLLAG